MLMENLTFSTVIYGWDLTVCLEEWGNMWTVSSKGFESVSLNNK